MVTDTQVKTGYKQTDVGLIPNDWTVKNLGEVTSFTNGKAHENYVNENGDYILVNSKFISTEGEVQKFVDTCIQPLKEDEITMVMSDVPNGRAIAKCFYVDKNKKYALNQRICALKSLADNPKYLFYQIDRNPYFLSFDDGVKQTNLRKEDVLNCPLPIPSDLQEQNAIAQSIMDVSELIEKLDQLIEKKSNIKQGTMQELLTGRRRLPGFSGEWKQHELPNVCWFQEGPGVRNTQFTSSGVKLLNGTNIFRGKIYLENTDRFISENEAYGPYSHFLADSGDIAIASSGVSIEKFEEKIAFIENEHLPLCMNTSTIRFKANDKYIVPKYLYYYLMTPMFKEQIGAQATGSAQLNFGPAHLKKIVLEIPGTDEQKDISRIIGDLDKEIEILDNQKNKYLDVKQGMMQQLLTGRIRLV